MQLKMFFFATTLFAFASANANDNTEKVAAELQSATVYRSGAELVHHASARLTDGNNELVIDGLSNSIDMNSVQVNCAAAVTILSVEFSNNFLVTPELSARVRFLKDSVSNLDIQIEKVDAQYATTTELLELLKINRDIKGSQTGLSVAELMKLMDYYKLRSGELKSDLAIQKDKLAKLRGILERLEGQIKEEETKNTKQVGQLRLQLAVAISGSYEFKVSYVTPNAYWSPTYDIRMNGIGKPLSIVYKAKIVQTTGIEWKKIALSLSSSIPGQWGEAPLLKSWFLAYINPVNVMIRGVASNTIPGIGNQLQGKVAGVALNEVVVTGYGLQVGDKEREVAEPLYIVNGAPMSKVEFSKISPSAIKKTEWLKPAAAASLYGSRAAGGATIITLKEGLEDFVSVANNDLNVSFDIGIPYDVPGTGKEQTAVLKEYKVGALYKYYSVPKMDKDAYLLAEVADWEKLNLLPGDANIIVEGTYVGKSFIDPNSTQDTLNLTMGRDKRVVVKKEKLVDYSGVKFLGSNKVQKLTYEMTVKNNKQDTVTMILKDQYPLSTLKEIDVELLEAGGALVNSDTGVLTWKLELMPGESRKIRFGYSVKFPKEKAINIY